MSVDDLEVYCGRWGASKATHAMVVRVKELDFAKIQTANPATWEECERLREVLIVYILTRTHKDEYTHINTKTQFIPLTMTPMLTH